VKVPHHIVSADQLSPELQEVAFEEANRLRRIDELSPALLPKPLANKIIPVSFEEPSTRTFLRSCIVVAKLGGTPIPVQNARIFSSIAKGEDLEDTVRTCGDLKVDALIMRHITAGSAQIVAETLEKYAPWVSYTNAGDGNGEHPTQMGLDIYTIWRNKREALKNRELVVALVGELSDSRVFHSDAKALIGWGIKKLVLISEKGNNLPAEILAEAERKDIPWIKSTCPLEYAPEVDVWIFTRLQLERKKLLGKLLKVFPFLKSWLRRIYNKRYGMTKKLRDKMKQDALVMHPLPRVGEMPKWMDDDPRAIYLSRGPGKESQVTNGLYFQMAMLNLMYS